MAGMGPAPKPGARHRGTDTLSSALVTLPAAGREGETPEFPLSRPTVAEKRVWADLWSTPQAAAWESLGWTRSVARYVRILVVAEKPGASAAALSEVRQMEDRLGLTPMSMLRLRWAIGDEVVDRPGAGLFVIPDDWLESGTG